MKKGKAKNIITLRRSAQSGHFAAKSAKGATTKRPTFRAAKYARVISYIVGAEEEETRMMIAASDSMSSQ